MEFIEANIIKAIKEPSSNSVARNGFLPSFISSGAPIFHIWKINYNQGSVPIPSKTVKIILIYKGGSKSLPNQYCPTALTLHIIKLF